MVKKQNISKVYNLVVVFANPQAAVLKRNIRSIRMALAIYA